MENPLIRYVEMMRSGLVNTQRDFICPHCGGMAHAQASRTVRAGQAYLNLSAWCDNCHLAIEEDGTPEWAGWEAIEVKST